MAINNTDVIFARVYHLGRELANLRLTGLSSESELFSAIHRCIGSGRGLVQLILRNRTEGWSVNRPVVFA